MIMLDTHIWVWWVSDISRLSENIKEEIKKNEEPGLYISIISIWEVTKLYIKGRVKFNVSLPAWIDEAIKYPGIKVLDLNKEIIIQTTKLENFHKDPADQLIVSTSIINKIPLLTFDKRILNYKLVETVKF